MIAPVFVDTNVLLYALDAGNPKKQQTARIWRAELWRNRAGRISFQVLQEFYVKVCRKWPAAANAARSEVRDLLTWQPVAVDGALLERAWKVQERYHFSFWDALIVAAAKAASCRYLLTEDLQAGQNLDGVIVIDPFHNSPESLATPD